MEVSGECLPGTFAVLSLIPNTKEAWGGRRRRRRKGKKRRRREDQNIFEEIEASPEASPGGS